MKKIKLKGKLNLNKQTISKLNDGLMSSVRGGSLEVKTLEGPKISEMIKCDTFIKCDLLEITIILTEPKETFMTKGCGC